ncbi:plasmid maintenance system antidote protein [Pedobacter chinensis]|uniref:Plasmid maintenance system antidote protein n=1 Tax=Pedobacter chinensis TaxID=2282421 RepID=A0A369PU30_9SPHI|nr:plasmid maintenance system antidote protein [Pedobacter chinensis]RDC56161.1 plasmid maintenance system antidote protein [Pedobacter chinensis]
MKSTLKKYRGIHPGVVLERELKKRKLKKRSFALSLQEYPQIINDITKAKRGLTTALSIKIDKVLGLEEGTMLILQAYYDIKKEKEKKSLLDRPDFNIIRKILFWDTDINKIDWNEQYEAVIKRVFERGNIDEKMELLRFYGKDKILEITGSAEIENNQPIILPHLSSN